MRLVRATMLVTALLGLKAEKNIVIRSLKRSLQLYVRRKIIPETHLSSGKLGHLCALNIRTFTLHSLGVSVSQLFVMHKEHVQKNKLALEALIF